MVFIYVIFQFIVLHFTFRLVIHFELIFVQGVKSVIRFIFLPADVPFVQTPFVKTTVFSPLYSLCSFVKYQLTAIVWASCIS